MRTALFALSLCALAANSTLYAADVNPYTGTEVSVSDLKRQLEIADLEQRIAVSRAAKRSAEKDEKAARSPAKVTLPPPQFSTLQFPTDKLPVPGMPLMTTRGMAMSPAPVIPVAPALPAGPRLIGVIDDKAGKGVIVELNGRIDVAAVGGVVHGLKIGQIGPGWAEVGGKRLTQDNSGLALIANVDKQPSVAPAAAAVSQQTAATSPQVVQMQPGAASFAPPSFGGR